jgi:hypothetical protein
MSKLTQDHLELLLAKAALDSDFRERLKSAPHDAVKTFIELDEEDLAALEMFTSDLERFASTPLNPLDAKTWANGICRIRGIHVPPKRDTP